MTIENVAEQVAQAYDGALTAYKDARERDRMEQARVTGGVSKINKFAYEQFENEAANAIYAQRKSAMNAINTALASREAELTQAPSAEAVNYLAAISGRDDLTKDEVNAALGRYGDTHAAQRAIISAAKRSGIHFADTRTQTEKEVAELRDLAYKVEHEFTPLRMNGMSEGMAWIVKAGMRGQL